MSSAKVTGQRQNLKDVSTFKIPGSKEEYYFVVDTSSKSTKDGDVNPGGNIQIRHKGLIDSDVGVINPKTGAIEFNTGPLYDGSPFKLTSTDAERKYILANKGKIIDQAKISYNKFQLEELGDNPTEQQVDAVKNKTDNLINKGVVNFNAEEINEASAKFIQKVADTPEKKGTRGGKGSLTFGNHAYPLDLAKSGEDVIKFNMVRYSPKKFKRTSESPLGAFNDRKDRPSVGSVCLPIPGGIQDNNACDWGGNSMNAFQAGLAQVALTAIQEGLGEGADAAANAITGVFSDPTTKNTLANFIAGNAAGASGFELLTRTTGAIINPNLELLFQRPTLRPFSFQFKLTPRDVREQNEILKILRFFKQGMAPIRTQSQLYLKSPHTFRIQYIQNNSEHQFLHKFKECALQTFNVNYTPDGNYSTYESGVMTSYVIRMQLQELSPVFNDDYEESQPNIRGVGGTDALGRDFDDEAASNFGLGFDSTRSKNEVPPTIGF